MPAGTENGYLTLKNNPSHNQKGLKIVKNLPNQKKKGGGEEEVGGRGLGRGQAKPNIHGFMPVLQQ